MCTIAVTWNLNEPDNLAAMASAVRHRGPDTFEIKPSGLHGVAACRLAIYGGEDAPLIFKDKASGQIILLNGEIYNYRSLWEELSEKGASPSNRP